MQILAQTMSLQLTLSDSSMVNGNSGCDTVAIHTSDSSYVQNKGVPRDRPLQRKYRSQKVSHKRLSRLMRSILSYIDIDRGVERGELIECIFGLPRRYCGYFTDPCMTPNEKEKYERCYRRAQPVLSKCLRKLENRGFVRLIRHGRYVKKVDLTQKGRMLKEQEAKSQIVGSNYEINK